MGRLSLFADGLRGLNWMSRKRRLFDMLRWLEAEATQLSTGDPGLAALLTEIKETAGEDDVTEFEGVPVDEAASMALRALTYLMAVPICVGAILERLEETRMTCVEQAAFYHLSYHEEHQHAAEAWFEADFRNEKAHRKFTRTNREYRDLLSRLRVMATIVNQSEPDDDPDWLGAA